MPAEIITIQLGTYANHVGTHFWNIQDVNAVGFSDLGQSQMNWDVLHRTTVTQAGECYFPRLVVADFKSSIGTLRPRFGLEQAVATDGAQPPTWSGNVQCSVEEPFELSETARRLLALGEADAAGGDADDPPTDTHHDGASATELYLGDDDVSVWSDFLRVDFAPHTCIRLSEAHGGESGVFTDGYDLWRQNEHGEQVMERVRVLAEESSSLQGFNVVADTHGATGGFTEQLLCEAHDEYGRKSVLLVGCDASRPLNGRPAPPMHSINSALAAAQLSAHASLYIPLDTLAISHAAAQLPLLDLPSNSPFHTSSLAATAIDSALLPLRVKGGRHLNEHCMLGSSRGDRLLARLCMGMPSTLTESAPSALNALHASGALGSAALPSLSPFQDSARAACVHDIIVRGVMVADCASLVDDRCCVPWSFADGMPQPPTFPRVLHDRTVGAKQRRLAAVTRLDSSAAIGEWLKQSADTIGATVGDFKALDAAGFVLDTRVEVAEELRGAAMRYSEGGGGWYT